MKLIPYGHQFIDANDIRSVIEVLKFDWLTQGPKVKEFEDSLCRYTQVRYAVVVSSGTAALHLACLAAGIKKGDEVITSSFTFAASANCILYCGGRPVFADIEQESANIDPVEIRKKITKQTKAIIPVHFAGHPCEIEEIYRIAKKYGLLVIEDAAHALGAEYRRQRSGDWLKIGSCRHADMSIFSFHPVKSITTAEGGAVLTNSKELYEKLLLLRNHGIVRKKNRFGSWYYQMQLLGYNYRLTDIQCALGISQLKKLEVFLRRRKEIVREYNRGFRKIEELQTPSEGKGVHSAWHLYQIRLKTHKNTAAKRKQLFEYLRAHGIGVQVHYLPVYLHPYYRQLGYQEQSCPGAEDFYQRVISLPLYPGFGNSEINFVVENVKQGLRQLEKR